MDFIKKLQKQPEYVRKIIVWATVAVLGFILAFFWLRAVSKNIENLKSGGLFDQVNLPDIQGEFKNIPKIEPPELTEEELKQIEQIINEKEQNLKENGQQ